MTKIISHHDVDGLVSGYFTSYHVKNPELIICDTEFGDTKGMKEGDWMTDMHPKDPVPDKINVIDHHAGKDGYPLKRNYTLYFDNKPASLISWELFRDEIPKDKWWLVAAGVCGDGAPEMIPFEVFESCSALLYPTKTFASQTYGKWKINYFPTYKLLSSPINSFLRIGESDEAIRLVTEAQSPRDIITDSKARKAKDNVKKEFERIMRDCEIIPFNNLNVVLFYSDFRMSGYIASVINGSDGKTVMAINKRTKNGSVRGDLAFYWRGRLKELDYLTIEGHQGFCGCSITKNHEVLIEDLTKLLQ